MWWPMAVFGWPGPILATIFSVVGMVRGRVGWLVAAAVVLIPFSFYLLLTPRFWWCGILPALPLIAARAISRGAKSVAWVAIVLLVAVLLRLAWGVTTQPRPY
jgi:hypothetical protein